MAKRNNTISFTGKIYKNPNNGKLIIEEVDKKSGESQYFVLEDEIVQEGFLTPENEQPDEQQYEVNITIKKNKIKYSSSQDPFSDEE